MAANQLRTDDLAAGESIAALRVVVLASGSGTLTQALIDNSVGDASNAPYRIVAIGADSASAEVLKRASVANIATFVVNPKDFPDRSGWDRALAVALGAFAPDLIVSAGFMRIIGARVLASFGGRMINSHPAMLPAFPGAHAVRDALAAGVSHTGTTVHLIDDGMDTGEVIVQTAVEIRPGDSEATLHERIKAVEREQLTHVVLDWAANGPRNNTPERHRSIGPQRWRLDH